MLRFPLRAYRVAGGSIIFAFWHAIRRWASGQIAQAMPIRMRGCAAGVSQRGGERSRIDFEQHLSLADDRALLEAAREKVARNLRSNLRVDVAVERRDPFAGQRHVLRLYRDDAHLGRRGRRRRRLAGLAGAEQHGRGHDENSRNPGANV